jgi:hypothetical protein
MPAEEGLTMEYLVTMTTGIPDGTSEAAIQDVRSREAVEGAQLQQAELANAACSSSQWHDVPPVPPGSACGSP